MSEDMTQRLPDGILKRILEQVESISERLARVEDRLATLEDKVDRRLQDTRPIWEQVLVRIESMEARLEKVESGIEGLRAEMNDRFDDLREQIVVLSEDVVDVPAKQRRLGKRIDKLEAQPAQ